MNLNSSTTIKSQAASFVLPDGPYNARQVLEPFALMIMNQSDNPVFTFIDKATFVLRKFLNC